jgi:long-chain acyl-CoA synthetase
LTGVENLTDMVWANAERFGDTVSLRRRAEDAWVDVTAREFAEQVGSVAKGLIGAGLRPGDRVALPSSTRYEFAAWAAGGVPVAEGEEAEFRVDEPPESKVGDEQLHARRLAVGPQDLATIRDGQEISHGEVLAEVRATIAAYPGLLGPGNSMLIHLPLTEWFARIMSLACVYTRTTVGHSARVGDVGTFRPTAVVTEPRLLEQVYSAAKVRAQAEDRGRLFHAAATVAVDYSSAVKRGGPSVALRGKHLMASKFLYPKLRVALGGRCTAVISVGEPVDERLEHFFAGIGIPVHTA